MGFVFRFLKGSLLNMFYLEDTDNISSGTKYDVYFNFQNRSSSRFSSCDILVVRHFFFVAIYFEVDPNLISSINLFSLESAR